MNENIESPDVEPEDSGKGIPIKRLKGRRAFTNVRRELSDEELSSPAVQRMLIDDIERLEKENFDLLEYQEKFHEADKKSCYLGGKTEGKCDPRNSFWRLSHFRCCFVGLRTISMD